MEYIVGKIIIVESDSGEDRHYLVAELVKSGRNVLLHELDFRNAVGYRYTDRTRVFNAATAAKCIVLGRWDNDTKTEGRIPIAPVRITSS